MFEGPSDRLRSVAEKFDLFAVQADLDACSPTGPREDDGLSFDRLPFEVRGLLDETLVVCLSEFGRTPRFNGGAGRDHWGHVFSIALAGAGIRGGQVIGASDRSAAYPRDGRVKPEDITATIFHCLGYSTGTEVHDTMGRPLAISRGQVIRAALA